MAHHNSTPSTVLDAPTSKPVAVSSQLGFSRQERRHGTAAVKEAYDDAVAAGKNAPHASAKVSKVRHGRKARWNR